MARPYIKRSFGRVLTETPFNAAWVDAIKTIIPQNYRKFEGGGCWQFDPCYYACVLAITEHFHGSVIDSTGGVAETQTTGWKEKWEAYKNLDAKANHDWSKQRGAPQPRKAASSAFATLFVMDTAPKEVITAAYRALSSKFHPDKGGDHEVMARINAAYTELKQKGKV